MNALMSVAQFSTTLNEYRCYHIYMRKHTISLINALNGIWTAITTQSNIRIHFIIGSLVILPQLTLNYHGRNH
jgi:diacylglycerol kinase